MPRRSGGGRGNGARKRRGLAGYLGEVDIKIGDFADSTAAKLPSRVSKKMNKIKQDLVRLPNRSRENQGQIKSKLLTEDAELAEGTSSDAKAQEEDLAWDEKDWADNNDLDHLDHDVGSSHDPEPFSEEDEEDELEVEKKSKKGSKKKSKKKDGQADGGMVYPPDIWFMLADYIRPEDITVFSCLCRDAYNVTRTAAFWRKLYHRHVQSADSKKLPTHLRPSCIKKNHGLRASVIQALYLLHPPYKLSTSMPSPVGEGRSSPETITNYTCLYTWSRGKVGGHFTHFMKMRQCGAASRVSSKRTSNSTDIFANRSAGECILKMHCAHFQNVPSAQIMGLQLVRSSVSVSTNMRHHRVKLELGRTDKRGACVRSSLVTVSLDPVLKVEVLHWWHPQFKECSQQSIDKAVAENDVNAREQNNMWEGL